ncbi:MAG: hypothetical protein LBE17_06415 [Treponema sp.]|jgi:hypothetical protein|nr:hypothetical protein [Treponema sp.]
MKNLKLTRVFTFGALAIVFAGCFNPVTMDPPMQGTPVPSSFTVDVLVGKDNVSRSVAGPDAARIKTEGIRNTVQLIIVDKETGRIAAFDEVRRQKDSEQDAMLIVNSLMLNKTYYFLLLMGHWERDYAREAKDKDGKYDYIEANPPTLLATGVQEETINGYGTVVKVTMWPIVVDTEFTAPSQTAAPEIADGKPGPASLLPIDWGVTWTVKQGSSGNDGLADLIQAQKVIAANGGGNTLKVKNKHTIVRGTDLTGAVLLTPAAETGNVITLGSIGCYTSGITRIGTSGSAAFKLEYVPFNLTDPANWAAIHDEGKSAFDLSGGGPVWIIRNGVTDEDQNGNTDFTGKRPWDGTVNGNGAVRFEIRAGIPAPNTLVIRDGVFKGPPNSTTPVIAFTTAAYEGTAEVYYALVNAGGSPPAYSAYTHSIPGSPLVAGNYQKQITLETANSDYDVYVVLFKDGKVSAPVKINTKKSGEAVEWNWGGETGGQKVGWNWAGETK